MPERGAVDRVPREPPGGTPTDDVRPLVVITGAAGRIGRVLADRLIPDYRLRLLDRRPLADPGGWQVDLADEAGLERAFEGVAAVVHLAAASSVEADWDDVLASNVVGVRNVLEAARRQGVARVVFASSNHATGMYEVERAPGIYEPTDGWRLDTSAPVRPDSLYGVSKVFGEALCRLYAERHGLAVVCLRLGTVLEDDDPTLPPAVEPAWAPAPWHVRIRATWLSHADCVELFRRALTADVRFAVVYGCSDVPGRFWDLDAARELLGFVPRDGWPG